MLQLAERRMVELDPSLASHYLQYNEYKGQRPARRVHINYLANKIVSGDFRFGEVAFAVFNNGQKDLMMNGQHVCHAVIESETTVPCMLERYYVDNDIDVADLFKQFEILGRSQKDFVNSERVALGLDWPLWVASLVVAAATIEKSGSNSFTGKTYIGGSKDPQGRSFTKEVKAKYLREYQAEGEFVVSILMPDRTASKKIATHMNRAAVVFVMMQTYRIDKDDAKRFWMRVRDGENLTSGMSEMKLREYLLLRRGVSAPVHYHRATNHEYVYKSILAWNSFRTGKPTSLSYRPSKQPPKLK